METAHALQSKSFTFRSELLPIDIDIYVDVDIDVDVDVDVDADVPCTA